MFNTISLFVFLSLSPSISPLSLIFIKLFKYHFRANIEAMVEDIEEALDAISFDKSSRSNSRSTTPRSDMAASVSGQGNCEPKTDY